jgi:cysteine-rich repeat protein
MAARRAVINRFVTLDGGLVVIKRFGEVTLFALVAGAAGCSSNGAPGAADDTAVSHGVVSDKELGSVDFAFTAVPGLDISTISYDVVDATTNISVRTGTADVSNADAQATGFFLLPPGMYIATLSATGTVPCVGQTATFVVTAGGSVTVSAALSCGTGVSIQSCRAYIDATFNPSNSCGITEMYVGPLVQGNGELVTMVSEATANATFAWTSSNASAGTLNNANTANASLTCSGLGGTTTLTLTITDANDLDCTDTRSADVICIPGGLCLNGTVNAPEECDDGNTVNTDACTNTCQNNVCGDGILNTGIEACDDGNTVNDDACSNTCVINFCGDGIVNNGEACDGSPLCPANCLFVDFFCGNGTVDPGEQCDDGNTADLDACSNTCVVNFCGDGIVNNGEVCDDGDTSNATTGCDSLCTGGGDPGPSCSSPVGQACQAVNCAAEFVACQGRPLCSAVQACLYDTSAGPACVHTNAPTASFLDACYCGVGVDINNCYLGGQPATGSCRVAIETAAATGPNAGLPPQTPLQVAQTFYDPVTDMGLAGLLAYCQKTLCTSECGY